MSKLDWSKVSQRLLDPGRYQRRDDFLAPDQPIKSNRNGQKLAKPLSPAQVRRQEAHDSRIKALRLLRKRTKALSRAAELDREKKNAATKAKRKAVAKQQQIATRKKKLSTSEKKRLKEVTRNAKEAARKEESTARRAALVEFRKTPEYAEKIAQEQARMTAIRKSHLQTWASQQTGLNTERQTLRERWRKSLLNRTAGHE